jgi:hypothetical protein
MAAMNILLARALWQERGPGLTMSGIPDHGTDNAEPILGESRNTSRRGPGGAVRATP